MPARSALAIAILLAFAPAAAADNVDWNQYIEKPGTTYTPMGSAKPAAAPEAKPARTEKAAKKTVAAKPRTKAKAKAPVKARRKH